MKRKDMSVSFVGLHPAFFHKLMLLDEIWRDVRGHELIITSAVDGRHSKHSRHYIGCAVDIRTWTSEVSGTQMQGTDREHLKRLVMQSLGPAFSVLDEGSHFHISLKPQETKAWVDF